MLQERPDGDAGGGHLRREPQHCQPLLRPPAQGNLEREHPRGAAGNQRVRARRVVLRGETRARQARARGGGKVYVTVVPDCSRESLMPVIKGLILEQSTIYTDGWRVYDGIVLRRLRALPCVAGGFAANTTVRTSSRGARATSTASSTCKPAVCVELRQEAACEVQRLQLRRFRAILERVRMAVQSQARRPAGSYQAAVQENVS